MTLPVHLLRRYRSTCLAAPRCGHQSGWLARRLLADWLLAAWQAGWFDGCRLSGSWPLTSGCWLPGMLAGWTAAGCLAAGHWLGFRYRTLENVAEQKKTTTTYIYIYTSRKSATSSQGTRDDMKRSIYCDSCKMNAIAGLHIVHSICDHCDNGSLYVHIREIAHGSQK